jgi:aryl-alcohol dehydrogenase-like predicted oxidoreductase
MNYRKFGKLGWPVSEIGFGAWAIGGDMWGPQKDSDSLDALHKAVDLGVNFIDTAQGYGQGHSEELIGKFLKERHEELFIATKVPPVPGTPWPPPDNFNPDIAFPGKYIVEQCEKSLKRLQREYIDVYQFHTWIDSFNIKGEWFEAMSSLKKEGKIRAIGVSVHDTTPDSVIGALALGKVDAVQVIYNIFEQYPEHNLFPVCEKFETGVIVRVPFDEGALTGKFTPETSFPQGDVRQHYFRGKNLAAVISKVEQIEKLKDIYHPGMPMSEYALKFVLNHNTVNTVIPGIRNVKQAELNTSASNGTLFSEDELKELKKFYWRKDFWREEAD